MAEDKKHLEQELQGLREGLRTEVERLRQAVLCNGGTGEPCLDGAAEAQAAAADRLQALLDTYSVEEGSGG